MWQMCSLKVQSPDGVNLRCRLNALLGASSNINFVTWKCLIFLAKLAVFKILTETRIKQPETYLP